MLADLAARLRPTAIPTAAPPPGRSGWLSAMLLMASADWRLALPTALWFAGYVFFLRHFVPKVRSLSRSSSELRSKVMGRVVDSCTDILTVKLFARARDEDAYVRGDFDLTIRPGERIGLVGRSGAGKSTLVNLLLRFHRMEGVDGGSIRIDGTDIREVTQESLRSAIGMVTQDTSLLHRSIADNHPLRPARGRRWTRSSRRRRRRRRTSSSSACRTGRAAPATARMDRLVVLDAGRIVEQGTHAELLAKGPQGHYAQLWAHQSGGFIGEA